MYPVLIALCIYVGAAGFIYLLFKATDDGDEGDVRPGKGKKQ